jgi:hypothetical protein
MERPAPCPALIDKRSRVPAPEHGEGMGGSPHGEHERPERGDDAEGGGGHIRQPP